MSQNPRVLTEDKIDAIAAEARTKPLSEIGRHVMPLVQHIVGMDMRCCRDCALWNPCNEDRCWSVRGECTHPAFSAVMEFPSLDQPAVMTPADWCCRGWKGCEGG